MQHDTRVLIALATYNTLSSVRVNCIKLVGELILCMDPYAAASYYASYIALASSPTLTMIVMPASPLPTLTMVATPTGPLEHAMHV